LPLNGRDKTFEGKRDEKNVLKRKEEKLLLLLRSRRKYKGGNWMNEGLHSGENPLVAQNRSR
jgi:hypothetical protein